jgi:hypothetical protein
MTKKITNLFKKFQLICFLFLTTLISLYSQHRSTGSGNWSSLGSWETFNGSGWIAATTLPTLNDTVYVQIGHTITLTANAVCRNLNLHTGAGRLAIGVHTLEVYGKIRAYSASLGIVPGANSTTTNGICTSTLPGGIKFVGTGRPLISAGEWGAGGPTGGDMEFALNAGETGTFGLAFKARNLVFSSGNYTTSNSIRPDGAINVTTGTLLIKSGAKLTLGSSAEIARTGMTPDNISASVTVESGGTLEFSGSSPGNIVAKAVNFNGTVIYSGGTGGSGILSSRGGNTSLDADVIDTYNDITIQGAKTLSSNIVVNGTLSMRTTSTVPPTLSLGGFGLAYVSGATLQYRGIGSPAPAQTTSSIEWPVVNGPENVDIFNASGVTLHEARTIEGILKLSGSSTANLILGANNLTIGSGGSISAGASNKYIVTNGTGMLIKNNLGATPFDFPIGPSVSLYHPVTIKNDGVVDNFSVNVKSQFTPCEMNTSKAVMVNWDIKEAVKDGSNCSITAVFKGAMTGAGYDNSIADLYDCDIINGPKYYNLGNSPTLPDSSVTGSGFTKFSPFGVTSDRSILPVKLTSFTGQQLDKVIELDWTTASETNSDYFEVLSSPNGSNFRPIGKVKSAGNSSEKINYSLVDEFPHKGINYYQLRQVDLDGKFEFSEVITVENTTPSNTSIYPSLRSKMELNYIDLTEYRSDEKITINLYDASGRQITNTSMKGGVVSPIDFGQLNTGLYMVKISNQGKSETLKFSVY